MKFNLENSFTKGDFDKLVKEEMARIIKVTQNELIQVGLQFVRDARSKIPDDNYREAINSLAYAKGETRAQLGSDSPGFNDDTGNLRSSIGFILMYDGELVYQDFQLSSKGTDKSAGLALGTAYAQKLGEDYKTGWAIITVAGMEYASWVEALGYDVITGSTLGAQKILSIAFQNVETAFAA
ncbi:hypothetical protein AY601_4082 [Pedobacter cryoconitis]|uniref:Uncharacterized protein n=1 Tax=Pedobacter cryoconitis TaxID=188932 RepID=A0A127VI06_9SPHI|nr:hypothetical protein [Pedobacter cryoconitis]AMQ00933.1 hypothetical protein AY601_4082 [Pedobacter cryoconitis]